MSTSDDTQAAMTYPTKTQYSRWKDRANQLDMSVSEFMQSMVEAGIKVDKGFEVELERDESRQELRDQRNDLKAELERARNRIQKLENQLHRGERSTILECVRENPGATYGEIGQYVADSIPERLPGRLDDMEGSELRIESEGDTDRFYLLEEAESAQ